MSYEIVEDLEGVGCDGVSMCGACCVCVGLWGVALVTARKGCGKQNYLDGGVITRCCCFTHITWVDQNLANYSRAFQYSKNLIFIDN